MISLSDKKGEEESGKYIVAWVIGLLVLFVIIGIVVLFHDKLAFFDNLPIFGNNSIKVAGVEKLRYDSLTDRVQYYTGTKWVTFDKGEITLNEKKVGANEAKNAFLKLFDYSSLQEKRIDMAEGSYVILQDYAPYQYKRSDVIASLYIDNREGNKVVGFYLFRTDNSIQFYPLVPRTNRLAKVWGSVKIAFGASPDYAIYKDVRSKEIKGMNNYLKDKLKDLRDSLLNKMAVLTYSSKDSDSQTTSKFCVERMDKVYFVIDLQSEVSSDVC